jgi:serine/threonine protein kinase
MKMLYSVTAADTIKNKSNNNNNNFVFDAEGKKYMNCSHMARVLDILEDKKYYYCIMEYVRGRDLFEYFIQEKPHEKPYTLPLVRQIAKDICV